MADYRINFPDFFDDEEWVFESKGWIILVLGVVSGNGKYSTLRFFNCAQWPKFSTTYLGFASP
ncbi:hypothetical protein [Acinetobacter modestus]|uniref:hypothetical protein n=1 Tax=Acinetobacter modestus TaxID=1776740 RepID=UPI0005575136|nr:hypothetical protein [Acinetobacter modestus]